MIVRSKELEKKNWWALNVLSLPAPLKKKTTRKPPKEIGVVIKLKKAVCDSLIQMLGDS